MKAYVVYGSRYGATKKCGEYIAEKTNGVCTNNVDWKDASCIVLGTNVYAGMFHKDIKAFIKEHLDMLLQKRVILYVSGIAQDNLEKEIEENLSKALQEHIEHIVFVNGVLDFKKMNFMERKIIKMINKKANLIETIQKDTCVDFLDYQALDTICEYVEEA